MSSMAMREIFWEKIEAEYRTSGCSVREIARRHGISHTAINKRIKRLGWKKEQQIPDENGEKKSHGPYYATHVGQPTDW